MCTGKDVRDMTHEMDRWKQRERQGEILTVKAKGMGGRGGECVNTQEHCIKPMHCSEDG